MESLVIVTYSRRLQDMARSAGKGVKVLCSVAGSRFNIASIASRATRHDDLYK